MMKTFVALFIFLTISLHAFSNYWYVNSRDTSNVDFSTLQQAINSYLVSNGDTIYIAKSTMFERTILNKMLTIIGPGYTLSDTIEGNSISLTSIVWGLSVLSKANGSRIEGLTITGDLSLNETDNIKISNCKIKNIINASKITNKNMTFESCYIHGKLNADISGSYFSKNIFVLPENTTISIGRNCMLNENIIIGKAERPLINTHNSSVTNNTVINTAVCNENAVSFGYNYPNLNIGKNGSTDNQVYNNTFSAIPGVPNHNDPMNTYISPKQEKLKTNKKHSNDKERDLFNALNSLYNILQLPRNY